VIFTEIESGTSVEGQDIPAFKTDIKASKYLYLIGGTHGDEVEGVYVLKELFAWLSLEHNLKDLPIVVVPILNVDGYRAGTRVNSHQVDLNRNYPTKDWSAEFKKAKYNPGPAPLSEPENEYLVELFEKYPPSFVISFHTWKPILNYNGDAKEIADFIASFNNYPCAPDIGYETPGSLGTFGPERYKAPVLTFECPPIAGNKSLKEIWLENEAGLKNLMQSELLEKKIKN
jgi:protein MpaA